MPGFDISPAKMECLSLAVKMCLQTGDNMAVIAEAEKYWQWLNGSHDAAKTPERSDDIPF